MGQAQKLLSSEFSQENKKLINSKTANISRRTGTSGTEVFEEEPERIVRYISQDLLDNIFDITDARKAVNSLRSEEELRNLLEGAGVEGENNFINFILVNYGVDRVDKIKESSIILKSGRERPGIIINRDVYAIIVLSSRGNEFVQFREFKTGRVRGETPALNHRLKEALKNGQ